MKVRGRCLESRVPFGLWAGHHKSVCALHYSEQWNTLQLLKAAQNNLIAGVASWLFCRPSRVRKTKPANRIQIFLLLNNQSLKHELCISLTLLIFLLSYTDLYLICSSSTSNLAILQPLYLILWISNVDFKLDHIGHLRNFETKSRAMFIWCPSSATHFRLTFGYNCVLLTHGNFCCMYTNCLSELCINN